MNRMYALLAAALATLFLGACAPHEPIETFPSQSVLSAERPAPPERVASEMEAWPLGMAP